MQQESTMVKTDVQLEAELNRMFEDLYYANPLTNKKVPIVCTVCDTFIRPTSFTTISLQKFHSVKHVLSTDDTNELHPRLVLDYNFDVPVEYQTFTAGCLLSPRGIFMYDEKGKASMSVCMSCKRSLCRSTIPKWAIANGYYFGTPPKELLDLSPIERAWITPVNPKYGLVLVYHGGSMKQLKGTLSYFKKDPQSVATSVEKFRLVGLTEEGVTVAMVGSTTSKQKKKVQELATIRPFAIRACVEWLIEHNDNWKHIDLEQVRTRVGEPVLVQDHSDSAPDIDSNIETSSTFRVVFPDRNLDEVNGGQSTAKAFLEMVLKEGNGSEIMVQSQFSEERRVQDYVGNNFLLSCLFQFPYGRGGLHEAHYNAKEREVKPAHDEFIRYLSSISQSNFHEQLFVLKLFNYKQRDRMVRNGVIQCRNLHTAKMIAEGLTGGALLSAIKQRNNWTTMSTPAKKMLTAVDAIAEAAPHSNQAARKARNRIEVMQHYFGFPQVFLTVTPDDEHTILLDIYALEDMDIEFFDWEKIYNMTNDEIRAYSRKRKELRLRVPGICAWIFENQMDAIIEHVIGWDQNEGVATERDGYFGTCEAFVSTIEEQGRKSLHTHCLVWIRKIQKEWETIHSGGVKRKREEAMQNLCQFTDRVSSCELMSKNVCNDRNIFQQVFLHKNECGDTMAQCPCTTTRYMRQPEIIGLQRLRNLRHSKGMKVGGGTYLKCQHGCGQKWTAEAMIHSFITKKIGYTNLKSFPDKSNGLKIISMVLFQHNNGIVDHPNPTFLFEAAYNHHMHAPSSCFKKDKRSKKGIECRYRFPRMPRPDTKILDTKTKIKWYGWDGSLDTRVVYEPTIKRHHLDVFMNQSSPAVGRNKLVHGNTNITLLLPGAVATYVSKYVAKSTQKDDSAEFNEVSERVKYSIDKIDERNIQRRLHGELTVEERNRRNRSEALSSCLSMAFSTMANDTIGPPLAAYLLRNDSRFIMSHQMRWISMEDIARLLSDEPVQMQIFGGRKFPSNIAYDYLCRPKQLEATSPFDFYSGYTVTRRKPDESDGDMLFHNSVQFVHPSWVPQVGNKTGYFRAGVAALAEATPKLLQVSRCWLPDTACFGGSIREGVINQFTEIYSKNALMLFCPFRMSADLRMKGNSTRKFIETVANLSHPSDGLKSLAEQLKNSGSYTEMFTTCIKNGLIDTKQLKYLQNFQDSSYNCWKGKPLGDELQRNTASYSNTKTCSAGNDDDSCSDSEATEDDEALEMDEMEMERMESIISQICRDDLDELNDSVPGCFSTHRISKSEHWRQQSSNRIANMRPFSLKPLKDEDQSIPWLEVSSSALNLLPEMDIDDDSNNSNDRSAKYSDVLQIIIRRRERIIRRDGVLDGIEVTEANGSAEGILEWSQKSPLDSSQETAFEIITASFVLTFFEDHACGNVSYDEERFLVEKEKLETLTDGTHRSSHQLIGLLHGPGGSGKSWVVDLVMCYAQEYTNHMANFKFDKRTIVVTALTGSAATLLNGETLHSAFKLNAHSPPDSAERGQFENTRLIIVDEISFAKEHDMKKMDRRLQQLMSVDDEEEMRPFGHVHTVFIGDFRQLDPISAKPLYYSSWFKKRINCYMELTGRHRFKNDPKWGDLLSNFRDGTVTLDDIDNLNKKILITNETKLPENIKYATYYNKTRDSINTAVFEKFIREEGMASEALVVFADDIQLKDPSIDQARPLRNYALLWNNVSESGTNIRGSARMDPVLKLYRGIRILLTENADVPNGIANGTQAYLTKVVLKPAQAYASTCIDDGTGILRYVKAVLASQIDHIELKHDNIKVPNPYFKMEPKVYSFEAKLPSMGEMHSFNLKARQLPIISNNATTGHKLQGVSVDSIFVYQWMKDASWNYVVLSRARTQEGTYSREKLPRELQMYQVPAELKTMLEQFQAFVPLPKSRRHEGISLAVD